MNSGERVVGSKLVCNGVLSDFAALLELNPPASGPKTGFFGHLRFLGLTRENDLFFEPFVGCARKTWQDAGGALSRPTRLHEIDLVASRR